MKYSFLIIVLSLLLNVNAFGQKTELSLRLNSGLFSFLGPSAKSVEVINYNLEKEEGYTNSPYGNKEALTYGLSVNLARITKSNFKFGLDIGYEVLRSEIEIVSVSFVDESISKYEVAEGQTFLNLNFINLYPNVGYRLVVSNFNIDIEGGVDLGYCHKANENGYAKSVSREYKTKRDIKTIKMDIRPRFQFGISRYNIGVYVGVSRGVVNYRSGVDGGETNEVYSNMFRFGMVYKLFK